MPPVSPALLVLLVVGAALGSALTAGIGVLLWQSPRIKAEAHDELTHGRAATQQPITTERRWSLTGYLALALTATTGLLSLILGLPPGLRTSPLIVALALGNGAVWKQVYVWRQR